ncbi:MAG: hypothetical protein JNK60_20470 [Acidobacteria bacterium]|nr:hypothetical protein [Acidobacteriota bacterium]
MPLELPFSARKMPLGLAVVRSRTGIRPPVGVHENAPPEPSNAKSRNPLGNGISRASTKRVLVARDVRLADVNQAKTAVQLTLCTTKLTRTARRNVAPEKRERISAKGSSTTCVRKKARTHRGMRAPWTSPTSRTKRREYTPRAAWPATVDATFAATIRTIERPMRVGTIPTLKYRSIANPSSAPRSRFPRVKCRTLAMMSGVPAFAKSVPAGMRRNAATTRHALT